MDFLEIVQSKFQQYHKKNNLVGNRKMRTEFYRTEQKEHRLQTMDERRNLKDAITPGTSRNKSPKKRVSPHIDRLTKLKIWKQERVKNAEKQKAAQKPIFKVGGAKDIGFPAPKSDLISFAPKNYKFTAPNNVKPIAINKKKYSQNPLQRVTRSQKPVASPPLPLPTRAKKDPLKIKENKKKDMNITKSQNKILKKNPLLRQDAVDDTCHLENLENSVRKSHRKRRKSQRRSVKRSLFVNSSESENLISQSDSENPEILDDLAKDNRSKKKTLNVKKTPQKRLESESQNEEPNETRKSRRKSMRKSRSKENYLQEGDSSPFKLADGQKTPLNILNTNLDNISPENKGVYVSPFVTTSRGKGSVKKENLIRSIRGLQSFSEPSSSTTGASYFFTILNNEIARLEELCRTWSNYKESAELNEDSNDLIDVAVGQATLLMNKKFQQFEGLIHACQTGVGAEKEVTCEDLQGFWDMVYIQVENLNTRFSRLETMKENNWKENEAIVKPKIVKKRVPAKTTKSAASSGIREAILAARKNKRQVKPITPNQAEESVFNGGFFEVRTPHKNTPNKRSSNPTPKSILKSNKKKSNLNKSVLFKDGSSETE